MGTRNMRAQLLTRIFFFSFFFLIGDFARFVAFLIEVDLYSDGVRKILFGPLVTVYMVQPAGVLWVTTMQSVHIHFV